MIKRKKMVFKKRLKFYLLFDGYYNILNYNKNQCAETIIIYVYHLERIKIPLIFSRNFPQTAIVKNLWFYFARVSV